MSGSTSYHAGFAAEEIVADHYWRNGRSVLARRWRGKGGELDLITRDGDDIVFVEVKKSSSFAKAASSLGKRQMARLCRGASEFVATLPKGQLTPIRFDVAVVNGIGAVEIIENAFMEA